ncbi:MAG: class I SAM-dependent methyltransferase [Planctomycetota bacterium]|jgi:SAM-dependent methyltransferase
MSEPNRWEAFARENAESFILGETAPAGDPAASAERFFESGRKTASRVFEEVADQLRGRDLAIEFGCGVGRLLIPMAERFTRVLGVDIAPTMLAKLEANCERFGVSNAGAMLTGEGWDEAGRADLAYSWLVFQHIADFSVIQANVHRLASALKRDGVAFLQFDTRRSSIPYRLRNALPDSTLPRLWRRGIRRIRRSPGQLAALFDEAGFQRIRERGAGTHQHVFTLRKA